MNKKDRLIVALDVDTILQAASLIKKLYPAVKFFKVGSQLFTSEGPRAVRMVRERGGRVFLDLKFHDIPNTVAGASRIATRLGVYMMNVHTSAGLAAMEAAKGASEDEARRLNIAPPIVLGVTVLTSMDGGDLRRLGIARKVDAQVQFLAELARDAGLDGVVASANEAALIKKNIGDDFIVVTPGIRPAGSSKADQKRQDTPRKAAAAGADYIVCGRPIIEAEDPLRAAKKIIKEL